MSEQEIVKDPIFIGGDGRSWDYSIECNIGFPLLFQ